MRQQHKQQVQALNTRLEQLESEIQGIEQAYEKEKHDILSGADTEISSIEANYETKLHSIKDTADARQQEYTEHLLDMHNEIESLKSQHDQEMYQYMESFKTQEEVLKASESKLLENTGLFAKQKKQILQGKNKQIGLLNQEHGAQMETLEKGHRAEMDALRKEHTQEIKRLTHDISLIQDDILRYKSEFKIERNKNDTKQSQIDNHEQTIKKLETQVRQDADIDDLVQNISKVSLS